MRSIKYLILITLFTYSCGFKVINLAEKQKFYISSIKTSGDKRIGFNLKNKLALKTKDPSKININLFIDSDRNRTIKEKNSRNEITKYLITISSKIRIENNGKTIKNINLSEKKDYSVNSQYAQTINNENQAIKVISDLLIKKIIKEISEINFNDL